MRGTVHGWWSACAVWLAGWMAASAQTHSAAPPSPAPLYEIQAGDVRVDGELGDWGHATFAEVPGSTWQRGLRYALGYDATGLYVAAEVADQDFVRTPKAATDEDAVVMTWVRPSGRDGAPQAQEFWLLAGVPGHQSAIVRRGSKGRTKQVSSARIVEGPRDDGKGYVLEVFLPWDVLGGARGWETTRFAIRLQDVVGAGPERRQVTLTSVVVDLQDLSSVPPLRQMAEDAAGNQGSAQSADVLRASHASRGGRARAIRAFRAQRQLPASVQPRFAHEANVAADGQTAELSLWGRTLVIMGSSLQGGRGYVYVDLPVPSDDDVQAIKSIDVTGDGRAEVLVWLRQALLEHPAGPAEREVLMVHHVDDAGMHPVLTVEVARRQGPHHEIRNRVRFRGQGRTRRLHIEPGRARGWDESSYPFGHAQADDVEPLLLPWRDAPTVYVWTGTALRPKP